MKKILVVVDMQNDFIDGPLGTPEARAIVDNVCAKIREGEWNWIIRTMDTHDIEYLNTQEGQKLPVVHCLDNMWGWCSNEDVRHAIQEAKCLNTFIPKDAFGCEGLLDFFINCYPHHIREEQSDIELTLIGVCTDICVISNALLLKAHYPEMKIVVDAACCAGSSPEKHRMALEVMKSCQIDILNEVNGDQVDVENEPSYWGTTQPNDFGEYDS
jgi:nicotinamidase-related amidase